MKIGINRSRIDIDVQGTVFEIGIVPLLAHQLIAQHDNEEDADKKIELLFSAVEATLAANGYEYAEKWWKATCDLQMLQEFIVAVLQKDIPPTTGKKKAVVGKQ